MRDFYQANVQYLDDDEENRQAVQESRQKRVKWLEESGEAVSYRNLPITLDSEYLERLTVTHPVTGKPVKRTYVTYDTQGNWIQVKIKPSDTSTKVTQHNAECVKTVSVRDHHGVWTKRQDRVPVRSTTPIDPSQIAHCVIMVHHENLMIGPAVAQRGTSSSDPVAFYSMQLDLDFSDGSELKLCAFKAQEREMFEDNSKEVTDRDKVMWSYLDPPEEVSTPCRGDTTEGVTTGGPGDEVSDEGSACRSSEAMTESQASRDPNVTHLLHSIQTMGCKTLLLEFCEQFPIVSEHAEVWLAHF